MSPPRYVELHGANCRRVRKHELSFMPEKDISANSLLAMVYIANSSAHVLLLCTL